VPPANVHAPRRHADSPRPPTYGRALMIATSRSESSFMAAPPNQATLRHREQSRV
jgi:hypothetical protein